MFPMKSSCEEHLDDQFKKALTLREAAIASQAICALPSRWNLLNHNVPF